MKPENFCYWLQGFFEITESSDTKEINLNKEQIDTIRAHLNLVFFHSIDPDNIKDMSELDIKKYQAIHEGAKSGDRLDDIIEDKKFSWIPEHEIRYNC